MQSPVLRRRLGLALAGAIASLLVAAPAASAASTVAKLRVEPGGRHLERGNWYATGTARVPTAASQCSGSGKSFIAGGPNSMGIVDYAREFNSRLSPFFASDRFDFGLIVCRIGQFGAFGLNQAWLYKRDHRDPGVAADKAKLESGDEVLWYFANFATGANTGVELSLAAPARAQRGSNFTVRAFQYDSAGRRTPAAGVQLRGDATAVTGPDGRAQIPAAEEGRLDLRGRRPPNDIPTQPLAVCVDDVLSNCPLYRGRLIVGSRLGDLLRGSRGRDLVIARGGDDRINVRRGGRDRVRCGGGDDVVIAGPTDRVAGTCEVVMRPGG
jgi:hypothetical protein